MHYIYFSHNVAAWLKLICIHVLIVA